MKYEPVNTGVRCRDCRDKLVKLRTVREQSDEGSLRIFARSLWTYICPTCDRLGLMTNGQS